ncbi:undecaprenyl-diphosphate phosphatase [Desulfobacterota bacterium AH_259_B03_O07]|nr:undecaprenyl-diphosphate phosphatase [Desulfobacterota bacterium AH_259_B03_O07]
MDLIQSLILGFIQGVTEFFPISSTAHLFLLPWILSWHDPGLPFNVALHIGTLFALIYYFWNEWKKIVKEFIQGIFRGGFGDFPNGRIGFFIIIATIPGGIIGILFEKEASGILRNPLAIACSLFFFGLVLYFSDRYSSKEKGISNMSIWDSLAIGIFQAIAIFPGVSRSGIAITGGLLRSFNRVDAAKFSFLIAAPIIAGAAIFESRHLDREIIISLSFLAGILSSAFFGFLAIKYLLKYVQRGSYTIFVIYRIVLAIFIVFLYLRQ